MEDGFHKIVDKKEFLKESLTDIKHDLVEDKLHLIKDSTIFVLSVVGLYITIDAFTHTSTFVSKMYFATVGLLAFLLSKYQFHSIIADFDYMNISEDRYLALIDELERIDPEDEEVAKLDKRLHIK